MPLDETEKLPGKGKQGSHMLLLYHQKLASSALPHVSPSSLPPFPFRL